MTTDTEVTNKVLEAISLNMKESSMVKEIQQLDNQIRILQEEREKLEIAKRQYFNAQSGATRAAQQAKEYASDADKKIKEALIITEKAIAASKEADAFAALTKKPHDFNTPISDVSKGINQGDTARRELTKNLNEVRIRKEQLKKEGININLDVTTKTVRNTSI
jgi:hypothetical protein